MARPRKSLALLELSGSLTHNKKRHRDRLNEPQSNGPIGDPPAYFNEGHRSIWYVAGGRSATRFALGF